MTKSASKDDSIKLTGLLQYSISNLNLEFLSVAYRLEIVLQISETWEKNKL